MRKLGEREFNIFGNLCNNMMFFVIFLIAFGMQIALVEVGGHAVKTKALDMKQNLLCIGVGATSLISGVLMRIPPADWFSWLAFDEKEDKEGEEA
jgi:hypothetical protein